MGNTIILEYDPFITTSKITLLEDGDKEEIIKTSEDLGNLANTLTQFAYAHNIYNIKVRAPFAFQGELSRRIKETESSLYSKTNIKVEGI